MVHLTLSLLLATKSLNSAVIHISLTRTMVAITWEIPRPSQLSKPAQEAQGANKTQKSGGEKIHSCVKIYVRCFLLLFFFSKREMDLWLIYVVISGGSQTMWLWCDRRQNLKNAKFCQFLICKKLENILIHSAIPLKRPGPYLNNKKSAMEDHNTIFEKKFSFLFG